MGPPFEDEFAQRGGCRSDAGSIAANAIDGPVGIAAMARRHVIGNGGVLVITACSQMHGDPLASGEDLHGACGEPRLDFGPGEAMRHAVKWLSIST
jgi:hypothetical protein